LIAAQEDIMAIWVLAKKEIRLLLRDRLAAMILLVMPLLFISVLGLLVGDDFGQQSKLRITVVDLDHGEGLNPGEPWAHVVLRDLSETAGIKVETVPNLEEAEKLIGFHKRAAVVVFHSDFTGQVNRCSFLVDGLNPFHRDGVYLDKIGVDLLRDPKQMASAAIVEQVVQVTLLRVLLPWMIGKAFDRLSDPAFIQILGDEVNLPVPAAGRFILGQKITLGKMLEMAAGKDTAEAAIYREKVGQGVKAALKEQFKNYNLTGKTWASLTKSLAHGTAVPVLATGTIGLLGSALGQGPLLGVSALGNRSLQQDLPATGESSGTEGFSFLKRGSHRYQVLVPGFTVMFAFFLVLVTGWIFATERRQGTLKRLRCSPLTRGQILLGKLAPCMLISLIQGCFLLIAGRVVFGMRWGPDAWSLGEQMLCLVPVIFCTSLAAMGMSLLVAAVARTEMQVALFGAVPVLLLALLGGCVLPREMMPEQAQVLTFLTPQGWALDAYRELLDNGSYFPNLTIVTNACVVLAGFGIGFLILAWTLLRLD
jgi:ABC-2 type transport system permease protein